MQTLRLHLYLLGHQERGALSKTESTIERSPACAKPSALEYIMAIRKSGFPSRRKSNRYNVFLESRQSEFLEQHAPHQRMDPAPNY